MFSLPEVKDNHLAFLSQNLCQDPVEKFFGCQRQRGDTSDNPNVQEFYNNTGALWVVNSFCRGPATGNCRGASESTHMLTDQENAPLPKACRPRIKTPDSEAYMHVKPRCGGIVKCLYISIHDYYNVRILSNVRVKLLQLLPKCFALLNALLLCLLILLY